MTAARILVVDDEPDLEPLILQKFRRHIKEGELDFVFARHGEEALEKLQAHPEIDMVLSDINMPVMDGLTLLLRLGELDRLLRTVIVSAYDDMQNIRTAMNRGAFDFLTKPIDFQDFETTIRKTLAELQALRQSTIQRQELFALQNELNVASRIQQGILPRTFLPDQRFELYAEMRAARTVGGDFYDFFKLDESRLALAVGDVSGKGIPAAIYMAVSRTLLRATVAQKLSPSECMLYMNQVLLRQSEGDMFVTVFYGVLDLRTRELEYCIAGHTPPWLITSEGVEMLNEVRGTMLGLFEVPEIGQGKVTMPPGATLFVSTDGILDAENLSAAPFSESRLRAALEQSAEHAPQALVHAVFKAVTEFSAGLPQNDDITALAVQIAGARVTSDDLTSDDLTSDDLTSER